MFILIFKFKGRNIRMKCNSQNKIKEILELYLKNEKIDIRTVYFIYDNNKFNENLKISDLANEKDKIKKEMTIYVYELISDKEKHGKINDINNNKNDYMNKINYKFKNPNLKLKLSVVEENYSYGINDIFEIFLSYKDNKVYLVYQNSDNNLNILSLNNKKNLLLKGHKNHITMIKYFINNKNYNEYLVTADKNKIVLIWNVSDNYKIIHQIDTSYKDNIYSCLLAFLPNNLDLIITSTCSFSNDMESSATKIYSLHSGDFIGYINNTNNKQIYYLLMWNNLKNNKNYIIHFSNNLMIFDLLENKLYAKLEEDYFLKYNYYSGFINSIDKKDYLFTSSLGEYIYIWNLYEKALFKKIYFKYFNIYHIIKWNDKYIIGLDFFRISLKVIDLTNYKVISDLKCAHKDIIISVKKILHPIYGESLLTASNDKTIKLWSI